MQYSPYTRPEQEGCVIPGSDRGDGETRDHPVLLPRRSDEVRLRPWADLQETHPSAGAVRALLTVLQAICTQNKLTLHSPFTLSENNNYGEKLTGLKILPS